ncbi:hypothetical protein VTJ49DRAFT_4027 [Mycothermus thermophilus]|uniref:Uncharacterized protein n=1 Tax=Humicola insolens TaxID=85995 RepID=A0ABR3VN61_HUMIN
MFLATTAKGFIAACLVVLAQASPTSLDLNQRDDPKTEPTVLAYLLTKPPPSNQINMCTEPQGKGLCVRETYAIGECHHVKSFLFLNTATSEILSEEPYQCWLYSNPCKVGVCFTGDHCTFGPVTAKTPEQHDLGLVGWEHRVISFRCKNATDGLN